MTRHTIKAAFTRFVLIVSIVASIGVGSVGLGGTAEVAAMPKDCDRIYLIAANYWLLYQFWSVYDFDLANHYRNMSDFYLEVGLEVC
jgi:hypothetical protein